MRQVIAIFVICAGCGGPGTTAAPAPPVRSDGFVEEPWSVPEEYAARPISAQAGESYFAEYGVGDPYGAGIPYPLFRGLMKLYPEELGADFADFNERFGTIPSLAHPDDPDAIPLGFHRTTDPNTRVEFLVINCQLCHAARVPGPDGERVVSGLGNRRLRVHAYGLALARIAHDEGLTDERVVRAAAEEAGRLDVAWPSDYRGPLTIATLRELRTRFAGRLDTMERLGTGLPGRVATMEGFMIAMNTHLGTDLALPEVTGWARIPDVAPYRYRETNSFDAAATGAPVALVAEADFAFGVRPRWYDEQRHIATSILLYLKELDRDLPFPGPIDRSLATRGHALFEESCASCHGHYGRPGEPRRVAYTERVIPLDVIGTDPARLDAVTEEMVAASAEVEATRGLVRTRRTGGYVPRPLVNVWARGQYGHNGQWPDLSVLATPPAERPVRYVVSPAEPLDLERIGQRWRDPGDAPPVDGEYLYDATNPGFDVGGHTFLSDLPAPGRRAVLEYLKTL